MASVRTDICLEQQRFAVQTFQMKYLFAPIPSQVFLKHPQGNKKSIGILGDKIRLGKVLEKSGHKHRQAHTNILKLSYGF